MVIRSADRNGVRRILKTRLPVTVLVGVVHDRVPAYAVSTGERRGRDRGARLENERGTRCRLPARGRYRLVVVAEVTDAEIRSRLDLSRRRREAGVCRLQIKEVACYE